MTNRVVSAPNSFNTPWHRPVVLFSGEVGALIVLKPSLSPFHQPHLAIPFVWEFVSDLMVTIGLLHLEASGSTSFAGR
jgi:hypothetical protein